MPARSITEKQIRAAIKKALGGASKKYDIDETYVAWEVGAKGSRFGAVPIESQHEAGVLERILQLADIPAERIKASSGGFWLRVQKIIPHGAA